MRKVKLRALGYLILILRNTEKFNKKDLITIWIKSFFIIEDAKAVDQGLKPFPTSLHCLSDFYFGKLF